MNFDRNTIIGLALMILLVIGVSWYSTPSQEQLAEQHKQDSLAVAEQQRIAIEAENAKAMQQVAAFVPDSVKHDSAYIAQQQLMAQGQYGIFAAAASGEDKDIEIVNNKWKIIISSKGGMIKSATLQDGYTRYHDHQAVEMWDDSLANMKLQFTLAGKGSFSTDYFYFTPSAMSVDARSGKQQLVMKLNTSDPSKYMEFVYDIEPDSYALDCKVNLVNLGNDLQPENNKVKLYWQALGLTNEKGITAERQKSSVFYCEENEDRDYLSESREADEVLEKKVNWVAFKQDYFSAAVISTKGFGEGAQLSVKVPTDSTHTKYYAANLALPLGNSGAESTDLKFFFGPNDYKVLNALEVDEFDRIIDYGWSIIGLVNQYCIRPLFWFFSSFIGSLGLIILIVTLIIKMVLFPITWKNFLSSAKMRVLKPELDEINKRYEGKDAVEKQQAVMALYRQTGVNPFAGCIPVLLQMPILYAMFRFFPAEIVLRGKSFLWADDLAAYDSIFDLGFNIRFYGSHVSGFTLMMVVSTFVYTRMSMGAQPQMTQQPGMPNMKVMMNIFTFMMIFFFNSMPSGLTLYYFTANMISIGQMYVIKNYIIDEAAIRAKIDDNKKKPKKKSGFAQRLEEMQKVQQQKLAEQKGKKK